MEDTTFYTKTTEYHKQVRELEEQGKYEKAIELLKEEIRFIEGFQLASKNDIEWHNYYDNYRNCIRLLQRSFETNKKLTELDDKYNFRMNEMQEQLTKLKKSMDDIYKDK